MDQIEAQFVDSDSRILRLEGEEILLRAPAKVNLSLKFLGRLRNGYHLLCSLLCPIALADEVRIRLGGPGAPRSIKLIFSTDLARHVAALGLSDAARKILEEELQGPKNLAFRAAEAFLGNDSRGFEIEIEKRIPFGAGLGGGSADAAAVLLGLWRLSGGLRSRTELFSLASTLGADVPALLANELLLMSGIGERLIGVNGTESLGLENLPLILLKPPVSVPTAEAYSLLGLPATTGPTEVLPLLARELNNSQLLQHLGLGLVSPPEELKLLTLLTEEGNTLAPEQGNVALRRSERLNSRSHSRSAFTLRNFDSGDARAVETRTGSGNVLREARLGPVGNEDGIASFPRTENSEMQISENLLMQIEQVLVNDFQGIIESSFPAVREAVDYLSSSGAKRVLLCGSGSSVVACFSDARAADRAYNELQSRIPQGWFMTPTRLCPSG